MGIGLWVSGITQNPIAHHPSPNAQSGGFSPFMFGLVVGMSLFSALSMQWARKELALYEQQQTQRSKKDAQDVADALNFAILTEDQQTYSENYDLERARQYANSTGRTTGGQEYMVTTRTEEDRTRYGHAAATVAITGSDDTLLRSQIHRSGGSEDILRTKVGDKQAVAVYDTATARDQQVRTSNLRMEVLAEQLYAFYAGKYRFPTDQEFSSLNGALKLHDAWGNEFDYTTSKDNQKGTLSFTTPWNYTQTLNLSLKDDAKPAESGNDENEE
jgi:hypothetical protein